MRFYKNKSGRYEAEDGSIYFTCGQPVRYFDENLEMWKDGRVEHNGKDYYVYLNNGEKIDLYLGVILDDNR